MAATTCLCHARLLHPPGSMVSRMACVVFGCAKNHDAHLNSSWPAWPILSCAETRKSRALPSCPISHTAIGLSSALAHGSVVGLFEKSRVRFDGNRLRASHAWETTPDVLPSSGLVCLEPAISEQVCIVWCHTHASQPILRSHFSQQLRSSLAVVGRAIRTPPWITEFTTALLRHCIGETLYTQHCAVSAQQTLTRRIFALAPKSNRGSTSSPSEPEWQGRRPSRVNRVANAARGSA